MATDYKNAPTSFLKQLPTYRGPVPTLSAEARTIKAEQLSAIVCNQAIQAAHTKRQL